MIRCRNCRQPATNYQTSHMFPLICCTSAMTVFCTVQTEAMHVHCTLALYRYIHVYVHEYNQGRIMWYHVIWHWLIAPAVNPILQLWFAGYCSSCNLISSLVFRRYQIMRSCLILADYTIGQYVVNLKILLISFALSWSIARCLW